MPTISSANPSNDVLDSDSPLENTSVYVVRKDDSISKIAEMFNVSVNTVVPDGLPS